MTITLLLLGVAVGAAMAIQSGMNAELRKFAGAPVNAALISFVVGTVCLFGVALALGGATAPKNFAAAPWWTWSGGFLGAFNITIALMLVPRVGALALVTSVTAGQVLASFILDHYGWFGYDVRPMTTGRLIGGLLVAAGLFLVVKSR